MPLKRSTLALFVGPSLPIAALGLPMVVQLPPYYAGELGLDLATVGLVFFLVRLIDLPLDLLFGHFMDRTRTRLGRFRPWLIAGAVLIVIGAYMIFMAERGIGAFYLFFWLLLPQIILRLNDTGRAGGTGDFVIACLFLAVFLVLVAKDGLNPPDPRKQHPKWDTKRFKPSWS